MATDTSRRAATRGIHFIIIETASGIPWLDDLRCARAVTAELVQCEQQGLIESLAWVVLPRQTLWLLRQRDACLNACMALFKERSARAVQCAAGRSGRVWVAGYRDRAITLEDAPSLARDLVSMPLREGLAERLEQYPHWFCRWTTAHTTELHAESDTPVQNSPTPGRVEH